jgi:hypothetical protein
MVNRLEQDGLAILAEVRRRKTEAKLQPLVDADAESTWTGIRRARSGVDDRGRWRCGRRADAGEPLDQRVGDAATRLGIALGRQKTDVK